LRFLPASRIASLRSSGSTEIVNLFMVHLQVPTSYTTI